MRECGGCRVCCTAPTIPSLDKGSWTPCAHECATGCSAYDQRPQECRDYRCLWLKGLLPDWAWPGRTGLMVSQDNLEMPAVSVLGIVDPYWGVRLLKYLARDHVVAIKTPDGHGQLATRNSSRLLSNYTRISSASWPL